VKGIVWMALSSVGGWIGWGLGAPFGIFVAFMLSIVGTAIGVYAANRITKAYMP
jgi:hypothetical protein